MASKKTKKPIKKEGINIENAWEMSVVIFECYDCDVEHAMYVRMTLDEARKFQKRLNTAIEYYEYMEKSVEEYFGENN